MTNLQWRFKNSYTDLPPAFFARLAPEPVATPKIVIFNSDLAASLGLITPEAGGNPDDSDVKALAGNLLPEGADPIAQAYAGHQFGNFTMLGDGRAIVLGEHITPNRERFDIQLKGSGQTPFSRRGDGRATLGSMLREYIFSEAMAGLGIPTTRSLAVVETGERVMRDKVAPGAVLTRVATSHVRVGTFEFAAASGGAPAVKALADYAIERHFPELSARKNPISAFLKTVIDRQAQ
ncbi:MAG: protein adenylyltransferase SelO family protein, partial [Candidatus Riflebacteria bacterium]|nr:protein adenylyltransferase SelO family protein [Candidatus Riflebacteria bacterium]